MTDINQFTIQKIANLAKLKITESEAADYVPQIQNILSHFDELKGLNTDQIEPLMTPVQLSVHMRPDQAEKNFSTEELLKNAPDRVGLLFKVPPVV